MRSRGDELRLKAPDAVSTVRMLPSRAPECILVFLHGLLGDSYSWNVFNHHQRPSEYADCYYVDFSFESLRVEALSFHLLVREIELLMPQIVAASPAGLPVVLVGNSFGGHLALHLAAHRSVPVDGLVLFAPGGIEEVIGASQQLRAYRTVDRILEVSFERIFNDPSVAADMDLQARVARYRERLEPVRREFIRNLFGLMRSMKQCMLSHDDLRAIAAQTRTSSRPSWCVMCWWRRSPGQEWSGSAVATRRSWSSRRQAAGRCVSSAWRWRIRTTRRNAARPERDGRADPGCSPPQGCSPR